MSTPRPHSRAWPSTVTDIPVVSDDRVVGIVSMRDIMNVAQIQPAENLALTALYRLGQGLDIVDPDPALPYAANYLYMMRGEVPDPQHARAVEQYLMTTVDHGFNASTFTARVITSTGADLAAAVVGAIGAL